MPCDRAAAKQIFSNVISSGSFAEEWIRSQTKALTIEETISAYLESIPRTWKSIENTLSRLDVAMISNATSEDLAKTFESYDYDIVGLLAHHVESDVAEIRGIECFDKVITMEEIEKIAPTNEIIVHLGVCRSLSLIESFKARCEAVRVIASQAQVDPEFYLIDFAYTVNFWRKTGGDYIDRFLDFRNVILNILKVPEVGREVGRNDWD